MWQLVVSHCRESLDWIPSLKFDRVVVYSKCGVPPNESLPYVWLNGSNVGREAETFARHLFEQYSALAPITAFLQGNPDHNGDVLQQLRDTRHELNEMEAQRPDVCALLGHPIVTADADGCPYHCGLAVAATCERVGARRTDCKPPFSFAAGGQFVVTRARARRLSRVRYAQMLQLLRQEARYKRRAPLYPYVFERLWGRLLCGT